MSAFFTVVWEMPPSFDTSKTSPFFHYPTGQVSKSETNLRLPIAAMATPEEDSQLYSWLRQIYHVSHFISP